MRCERSPDVAERAPARKPRDGPPVFEHNDRGNLPNPEPVAELRSRVGIDAADPHVTLLQLEAGEHRLHAPPDPRRGARHEHHEHSAATLHLKLVPVALRRKTSPVSTRLGRRATPAGRLRPQTRSAGPPYPAAPTGAAPAQLTWYDATARSSSAAAAGHLDDVAAAMITLAAVRPWTKQAISW